jgi:hypothetical protein
MFKEVIFSLSFSPTSFFNREIDLNIPTLQKLAGFKTMKDRLTFHTSSAKSKQIKS